MIDKQKYEFMLNIIKKYTCKDSRELVLWGNGTNGRNLKELFLKNGIGVPKIVDQKNYDGLHIESIDVLKNNIKKYFVIISMDKYFPEIEFFVRK